MSSVCMSTLLRKYKPCFLYSKPMLPPPPPYKTTKTVLPNNFIFRTHYSQRNYNNSTQHTGLNKLRLYKGILALCLFSGTLGLAWRIKKERGARLKVLLEDCVRIPMDHQLFGAEVSAYRYNGHVFPGIMITSGLIKELQDFQFTPDDIIVASYPKAGTTWVQEIVYMLTHDCLPSDHTSPVLETRFPYLEYPYPGWRSLAGQEGRRWVKTHLPLHLLPHSFTQCGPKLIYISRNPRDTAVSYYYFMQLLTQCSYKGTFSQFIHMFVNDVCMYSPFFSHVLGYWNNRHQPNILFITYEQLHHNPKKVIKEIADFLEISVSPDDIESIRTCTSFTNMTHNTSVNYQHWKEWGFAHKDKGNFLRKGEVGNWKSHLNEEQVLMFEEWEQKHLKNTDLKFIYEEQKQEEEQEQPT